MNKKPLKRTEKFLALSKPEQRVVIAKDVIAQLKAKKVTAVNRTYIEFFIPGVDYGDDAQSNLSKMRECQACALGNCMLSLTKFANTLTIQELRDFDSEEPGYNMLREYFSPEQLAMIEYAFEGFSDDDGIAYWKFDYEMSYSDKMLCWEFYLEYEDAEERLIAIMTNIVTNSGEFVL